MNMKMWHLTFSSDGRNSLFINESSRLTAVRELARVAGGQIILFCLVDEHIHVAVLSESAVIGRIARSILLCMRQRADGLPEPAHLRQVKTRSHMQWLVRYLLEQPSKHGLPGHQALWSGSCFLDLAGCRIVQGLQIQKRLTEVLPRLRLRDIYQAVGLPSEELNPLPVKEVTSPRCTSLIPGRCRYLVCRLSTEG